MVEQYVDTLTVICSFPERGHRFGDSDTVNWKARPRKFSATTSLPSVKVCATVGSRRATSGWSSYMEYDVNLQTCNIGRGYLAVATDKIEIRLSYFISSFTVVGSLPWSFQRAKSGND